jgi:hypothetical protein
MMELNTSMMDRLGMMRVMMMMTTVRSRLTRLRHGKTGYGYQENSG